LLLAVLCLPGSAAIVVEKGSGGELSLSGVFNARTMRRILLNS